MADKQASDKMKTELGGAPKPDGVPKPADPVKSESEPSELEKMRAELDVMRAQLATALQMIPQQLKPEVKDTGITVTIDDNSEPPAGTKRRKYRVSLPHCRIAIVPVDVVPGTEHMVRQFAVDKYNRFFGIIKSEHAHTCEDVTNIETAA